MRRALLTLLLVLAFPAVADAATVKVVACEPALDPAARTATFEARVRAARGSDRMQVRFTLYVRERGSHSWQRLTAPGFDDWLTSESGVRRYLYAKTVTNLSAPASYRTVVRFRWLDEDGDTLKSARDTSSRCRQPDLRPNLVPQAVDMLPAREPDMRRYEVTLRNGGRTDALPFVAALGIGDASLDPVAILGLPAYTTRTATFVGPACKPGEPLTVTLDPGAAVDERDEDDNVLVAPCPARSARR
jgi:CARDB